MRMNLRSLTRGCISYLTRKRFGCLLEVCFLIFICFLTALYRWKFVVYPVPLNPDEVQAGANVLRFMNFGLSWDSLDGTTVGPLNTAVLAWPVLFGWDVTLSTIRLTALVILCLVLCATYLTLRIIGGKLVSATLLMFLVAFYSFNSNFEFQHYSSELLPLLFITLSLLTCFYIFYRPSADAKLNISFIIPLGVLLGSVPFAKIQAAPIALAISFFVVFLIFKNRRNFNIKKPLGLFFLSGILPALYFLAPLALRGEFNHFWKSYIIWPTLYIKEPLTLHQFFTLLLGEPLLTFVIVLPIIVAILFATFHTQSRHDNDRYLWGAFLSLVLFSSWFSIARPGNMFPHYLMFFPSLLILLMAYALKVIEPGEKLGMVYRFCYFSSVSFLLFSITPPFASINKDTKHSFKTESPRIFDYLGVGSKDALLVWGWMPQWYIKSGLIPAARESMNNNQIASSRLQDYYMGRLLNDLNDSSPTIILDAVAGKSFGFNREAINGLMSFDPLAQFVESNYRRVQGFHVNPDCARLYVRNDRARDILSPLIGFRSVSASASWSPEYGPENVDDFSVTEDSCSDFWLLPNNQTGRLDIRFHSLESVKRILLLNTANSSFMNHGSSKLEITLSNNDDVVKKVEVDMKPYPQWTTILMDEPIVSDSIRISVLSWTGNGGGLNEVKVFR